MLGNVVFTNEWGNTITFNADGGVYPITSWDYEIQQRFEPEPRSAYDGTWATYDYDGGMQISFEGAILASSSSDYTTKRNDLATAFRDRPSPRLRRTGILVVDFTGTTENVKADVSLMSISIPRNGAGNAYSEFRIELFSNLPYWVGVTSSDVYFDI